MINCIYNSSLLGNLNPWSTISLPNTSFTMNTGTVKTKSTTERILKPTSSGPSNNSASSKSITKMDDHGKHKEYGKKSQINYSNYSN